MGTLFIVATPIGNLSDISARALDTLRNADVIACEDTRQTRKLLTHFGIQKALTSYHDFNERERSMELAGRIEGGENVALVSDAGTPAISDPGYRLVRLCRERGLHVVSIPGANAAMTALSASGLPSDQFLFVGFLPPKKSARREFLKTVQTFRGSLIFYEGPHRIQSVLEDIQDVLGDRETCIGRELTKLHEEYLWGKLSEIRPRVKELGEFVIVAGGFTGNDDAAPVALTREGVLKTLGISRNQLYELFFKK